MRLLGVRLQNFKSFPLSNQDFIPLAPLTQLIGKNNAGKSNVLQALHWAFTPGISPPGLDQIAHDESPDSPSYLTLEVVLSERHLKSIFHSSTSTGRLNHWLHVGEKIIGHPLRIRISLSDILKSRPELSATLEPSEDARRALGLNDSSFSVASEILNSAAVSFWEKCKSSTKTILVPATRGMAANPPHNEDPLRPDGSNLASFLKRMIDHDGQDHQEVEIHLRNQLLRLFPELDPGTSIRVKTVTGGHPRVAIEEPKKRTRHIVSNYGNGLSNSLIILSSLRFLARALKSEFVIYLIEEPEHGLHPELQRRLLSLLSETFDGSSSMGIMTTQSPSMIAWSGNASLCRIAQQDGKSTSTPLAQSDVSETMSDLGFYQSHVLLSDVTIFTEGITDARALTIILKAVGLDPAARNIGIIPIGGACNLMHLEPARLKSITPNFIFFMDSDREGASDASNPSAAKSELEQATRAACGTLIMPREVRELENLFPTEHLRKYFSRPDLTLGPFDKIETVIPEFSKKRDTPKIAEMLTPEEIESISPFSSLLKAVRSALSPSI